MSIYGNWVNYNSGPWLLMKNAPSLLSMALIGRCGGTSINADREISVRRTFEENKVT